MANYSNEINAQILISALKFYGIKWVIASPGTTNMAFVTSIQNDSYFKIISAVDERSAAYMACGIAGEIDEPVVISCTGATASRNYSPGMTEAYYRKLPIMAVTSSQDINRIGHLSPQLIDRTVIPKDVAKNSYNLEVVKDEDDEWSVKTKISQSIIELRKDGGGPVHLNLTTTYSRDFSVNELPSWNFIRHVTERDSLPDLKYSKIGIFIGSHKTINSTLGLKIDEFCERFNGAVFCDHTSGYHGKYRVLHALRSCQRFDDPRDLRPNLTIHIGEVSGDYYAKNIIGNEVWRVSPDGEIRDTFRRLTHLFGMDVERFFDHYLTQESGNINIIQNASKSKLFHEEWSEELAKLRKIIPELPLSNNWIAQQSHNLLPNKSTVHFAILNSLRSWNFFDIDRSVKTSSNVGGFGIDGCLSTLIGASITNPERLFYLITGDLAFFYDLNSIGNRHIGRNLRIILINNGTGIEFKNYNHPASEFGEKADLYNAASGHFGNKSRDLVKNYTASLGIKYIGIETKNDFSIAAKILFNPSIGDASILVEVFTNSDDESQALEILMSLKRSASSNAKNVVKSILGKNVTKFISGIKS